MKLRIAVLMGGKSVENEVSFNSGRTICDHLDTNKYEIIPIFQTFKGDLFILPLKFLHRGKTSDFLHRLEKEAQKICWDDFKELIDFVYIAVHGRYAEDGTLQGMLEVLGIPYLGSGIFTSAVTMDKIKQRDFLQLHGIEIPRGIVVPSAKIRTFAQHQAEFLEQLADQQIAFPVIVKQHQEGSSLGVSLVHRPADLAAAVLLAGTIYPQRQQAVLIEEKMMGMEFS